MKCPKCNKEMNKYSSGNMMVQKSGYYRCSNKKCWFWGIERYDNKKSEREVNW